MVYNANPLKSAYGIQLDKQNLALQKMEALVKNLYWRGKKARLPFEYGILANINVIRELRQDLSCYGYNFLLTARVNQDVVENMFSCIRYGLL